MNTDNTANTTNDSEKDLPSSNPAQQYKNQEGESHSTASEGILKSPDELPNNFGTTYNEGEEQDLDDIMHKDEAGIDEESGQATPLNKEQKFTPDDITS